MTSQNDNPSTRRASARPIGYLLAAVAATAANLALWAAGVQHTIATGMLVGTACAGVVCWRQAVAEERTMRRLDQLDELVTAQRVVYLPQQAKGQAVRQAPGSGLTPEAIAAARALARRIVDVETRERDAQ